MIGFDLSIAGKRHIVFSWLNQNGWQMNGANITKAGDNQTTRCQMQDIEEKGSFLIFQ